jgi:hypothetical protein
MNMTFALRAAIAAVRGWTKVYTWGLLPESRDARRDEIESDLWESINDREADRRTLALQIAARLIIGIPDDLGWRSEHVPAAAAWRWRIALAVFAVVMFGLWLNRPTSETTRVAEMLKLIPAPDVGPRLIDVPPPPPPPPPPCAPEGFPQPPGACIR